MIDARRWPVVEVCDPSAKRGMYLLWAAFSPDDFVYVVRAKHVPNGSFDVMSHGIKAERSALPRPPIIAIMDQRGGQFVSNRDLEKTFFDEFHERGLHYEPSVDYNAPCTKSSISNLLITLYNSYNLINTQSFLNSFLYY